MTKRLYYTDSYRTEFEAALVALNDIDGKPALLLDETIFYPTSGGQAHDLGELGGSYVVDVFVDKNGDLCHLLAEPIVGAQVGDRIEGAIDWPRRYDHMQQHSAQHLLSHAFHRLFGCETVSVHFGAADSTIDLENDSLLTPTQLDEVEAYANDVVYANLPIRAYMRSEAEVAALPLRRPPKVRGEIRIVEIDKLDYSACGGTHCRQTGELGPIKLLRQERSRGHVRVTFVSGWRALRDYGQKHKIMLEAAALYSTEAALVPEAISRSMEQNKALIRRVNTLTEQLITHDVNELARGAQHIGDQQVVVQILPQYEAADLRKLAQMLREQSKMILLLATISGEKTTLFFARSDDLLIHMGDLLRSALREFGGGGGGRPEFAQGGGIPSSKAQALLDFAVELLRKESVLC